MMGLVRTLVALGLGGIVAWALPRAGILAATQEIIAFLSLLMAGLLPAMVVTATVLRGDGFSAKRLEAYGGGLRLQLRFWGVLFAAAGIATAGVVAMKIVSAPGVAAQYALGRFVLEADAFLTFFTVVFGAASGVVLQRLWPAYQGLQSLLTLNVTMARAQALANDRSIADALQKDVERAKAPEAYMVVQEQPRRRARKPS